MEKAFLSCKDIAELMGIEISTVRAYCNQGKIPCLKVGRSYRIAAKDFYEWFEEGKTLPADAGTRRYLKKLQESEQKYKNLVSQSLDGIIMTDFKGSLVLANPSFCQMLDYSDQELLGTNFAQYIHADERAQAVEHHMRCVAGEAYPQPQETRFIGKGGATVFVEILGGPIWEDNKVIGVQKMVRDITSQTRLAQELEMIIEMLPSAFVINDLKGKAYRANSRVLELTGYTREEILAMESVVNLYWYPEDRAESIRLLRENGEFYNREFTGRLKGDRKMDIAMHAKLIEIGGETYVASLCQDNTKRKQMQKELDEAKQVLERAFNALNFGVLHLSADLEILFVNAWIKEKFPRPIGKTCHTSSSRQAKPCSYCPSSQCLKSGTPEQTETVLKGPDGTPAKFRISAYPITGDRDRIEHIVETIVNLDQRQQADWDVFNPERFNSA